MSKNQHVLSCIRLKPKQDDEDEGAASSGPADLLPGGGQFGVHNLGIGHQIHFNYIIISKYPFIFLGIQLALID